jgi:endonuclease G
MLCEQEHAIDVPAFASSNQDFAASGYDRGHLASAANWRHDEALLRSTFSLANVSPQIGEGFNRDYWARYVPAYLRVRVRVLALVCGSMQKLLLEPSYASRLEGFSRHVLHQFDEVCICTGPVFAPTRLHNGEWVYINKTIGTLHIKWSDGAENGDTGRFPHLVHVPTHFFKVIFAFRRAPEPILCVCAFLLPNKRIEKEQPLLDTVVRMSDLEALTGLRFDLGLLTPDMRNLVDERWDTSPALRNHQRLPDLSVSLLQGPQTPLRDEWMPAPVIVLGEPHGFPKHCI